MTLLIKNGIVVNPGDQSERRADLLVKDGVIAQITESFEGEADRVLMQPGLIVYRDLLTCMCI